MGCPVCGSKIDHSKTHGQVEAMIGHCHHKTMYTCEAGHRYVEHVRTFKGSEDYRKICVIPDGTPRWAAENVLYDIKWLEKNPTQLLFDWANDEGESWQTKYLQ